MSRSRQRVVSLQPEQWGHNGPFSIPPANSPLAAPPFTAAQFKLSAALPLHLPASLLSLRSLCGQVEACRKRQPPSAAPDELVAMGTVNGLESGDFGPDINTQRLILPAGRQ